MTPCCEGATSCGSCAHPFCREEQPTRGDSRLCATCEELAERLSGWGEIA